jgi:hypothetical protein
MSSERSGVPLSRVDRGTIAGGLVCLVAGVLLLVLVSGFAAMIAGICLLGLAGVAFVSLLFLLVGEGEDRDYDPRAP